MENSNNLAQKQPLKRGGIKRPGDKPEFVPEERIKVKLEVKPGVTYDGETFRGLYDGVGILIDGFNRYEGRWVAGKK